MVEASTQSLIERAEKLYASKLRALLEPNHLHKFLAIEPESGEFFLGDTLSEAIGAARRAHPNRLTYTMRIGHDAALHFGMQIR